MSSKKNSKSKATTTKSKSRTPTKSSANSGGGSSIFSFGSKKKQVKSKSLLPRKKDAIKANANKASNSSSKSKKKFTSFEKCPGYDSIVKAQNFEHDRKYNAAIKHYTTGISELEEYTKYNVDNAKEKRERMERIESYRHRLLRLQHQQKMKQLLDNNAGNTSKNDGKPTYIALENEDGYKYIVKARQYQNDDRLQDAFNQYEKGLLLLERGLPSIKEPKEKEMRRNKIREWRSAQQKCKNEVDNRKNGKYKKAEKKAARAKAKPLEQEPGYQFCEKASQFEQEYKGDAAIVHYEKGIPLLEETLKSISSSHAKRERMRQIDAYRHALQKLKNSKVRETPNAVTQKKRKKAMSGSHKRSNSTTSNMSTATQVTISGTAGSSARRTKSGGMLYRAIRHGMLNEDAIKAAQRMDIYSMLPILASSVIHLPLPYRSRLGDGLLEAINQKIDNDASLQQRLRFFLYSYYAQDTVQALWGDHPCMPNVVGTQSMQQRRVAGSDRDDAKDEDSDEKNERMMALLSDADNAFEDVYLERDAISFLRALNESSAEIEIGQCVDIDSKRMDMDVFDVMGRDVKIHRVKLEKIFKSNAKPLLLSAYERKSDRTYKMVSKFIIKAGDDLRLDAGAMHTFRLFNSIWAEEGLFYDGCAIQCFIYNVIPMGENFGAIEFIPKCKPLRNVSEYAEQFDLAAIQHLVASAAGSYIASFVLGVRDRHYDNVLIRSDGTLFHIDFGYVMGQTLFMDTSKIAITGDLKKLFEDHWDNFVDTATNAYMTLRLHYQEILDFSNLVFDFVDSKVNSSEFLYKMLMMHETDKKAEKYIHDKLAGAPTSWTTKMKNAAHFVATL